MASVKIALDNLPEDARVEVPYLGEFKNNTTTTVDDQRWQVFLDHTQNEEYEQSGELVISTAQAEQFSETLSEIHEAARAERQPNTEGKPLSEYNKDELKEMARALNIEDVDNMLKAQLVHALEEAGTAQPSPGQQEDN